MDLENLYGPLKIAGAIGVLIAVLAVLAVVSLRALRRFVREFWPH
jgi:hypothetical protein